MVRRGDDDEAPWLSEAEARPRESTTVTRRSMFWTITVLLVLAGIAIVGTIVLVTKKESGSSAGYMNAEQAPLITAPPGPYKVKPDDPQGMAVDAEGQAIYATGEGNDPGGTIDGASGPEEPMTRPGSVPVAPGAMSSGLSPSAPNPGPPRDLLPKAIIPAVPAPTPATPAIVPPNKPAAVPPANADKSAAKPHAPLSVDIPRDEPVAKPRPAAEVKPKPVADAKPKPAAPAADAKPADTKPGGKATAQLGAFKTEAAANAAWVAAGSPGGFGKSIEAVETAGGTLYRLRATGGDGAALCAKLAAKGAACKVVGP